MAQRVLLTVTLLALASTPACQAIKTSSVLESATDQVTIHTLGSNPNGIYSYDFESGVVAQIVATEATNELIKYTFFHADDGTHFYYVIDQADQHSLFHVLVDGLGTVVQPPSKLLPDTNFNGPSMCPSKHELLIGELKANSVTVGSLNVLSSVRKEPLQRLDFIAGDLHCRDGIEGFFTAGLECPVGGSLGACFGLQDNDSVSRIYWAKPDDADPVPISHPEGDAQVAQKPRPRLSHKGDVDPSILRTADGRVILGFSRLYNSAQLDSADTPSYLKDMGYQKLVLKEVAPANGLTTADTEVDLAGLFRGHWGLGPDAVIDLIATAPDLRWSPSHPEGIEFVVKVLIAERPSLDDGPNKFDGLLYGRMDLSQVGNPKVGLSEMRGLMTTRKFTCGVWKSAGMGDPDGNVYMYSMAFSKFAKPGQMPIYFTSTRFRVGEFLNQNGGEVKLATGAVVPATSLMQGLCGS